MKQSVSLSTPRLIPEKQSRRRAAFPGSDFFPNGGTTSRAEDYSHSGIKLGTGKKVGAASCGNKGTVYSFPFFLDPHTFLHQKGK